jgi:hypothetical protein
MRRRLAELMRNGLLQASGILPAGRCALRDLTRYRMQLGQKHSRAVHQVEGARERANSKLAAVATAGTSRSHDGACA